MTKSTEAEKEKYQYEKMQQEQLRYLRSPITRMEVQDLAQRIQVGLHTIQLATELLAQFFADKGQLNIEEFRSYCISKMKEAAQAQAAAAGSGPTESAGQEAAPNGIVLTDGADNAPDTQRHEDSSEYAE